MGPAVGGKGVSSNKGAGASREGAGAGSVGACEGGTKGPAAETCSRFSKKGS